MDKINIFKMSCDDTQKIAELEKECFSLPWSSDALLEEINNPNAHFLVAKGVGGEILGYIGCHFVLDEASITNIAVFSKHRNKGVGKALLKALLKEAKNSEISKIYLEVRESNTPAINLYKAMDFKEISVRKNFYSKPTENALILAFEF